MKYSFSNSRTPGGFPAGNPIANVFVVIIGALAIGASLVLGFFAFIILGSIVLMMAAIISLRVWWLKRKLRAEGGSSEKAAGQPPGGVIEGEYQVVADDREAE